MAAKAKRALEDIAGHSWPGLISFLAVGFMALAAASMPQAAIVSAAVAPAASSVQQSTFENPGFETGDLQGWTTWGQVDGVQVSGGWYGGIPAHSGGYFLGTASQGGTKNGGVYQRVYVAPDASYSVSAWYFIFWNGGSETSRECWLGVDPSGGTNPTSDSIVWDGPGLEPVEWGGGTWHRLSVESVHVGGSGAMTVFLKHAQKTSENWNINCFDDVLLEQLPSSSQTQLNQGWNMISLPLEPADPSPPVVFGDCLAAGNVVQNNLYRYDSVTGYQLYPLQFMDVVVKDAYWLHLDYACANTMTGYAVADKSVSLNRGWNFVGVPDTGEIVYRDVVVASGAEELSIEQAVQAGWLQPAFYHYENGGYRITGPNPWHSDQRLGPWRGYWVYASLAGLRLSFEPERCADGTPYGVCSETTPLYCDNGTLVNNCQACGCELGFDCDAGGACTSPPSPPTKSKLSIHTSFFGPYSMQFIADAKPTVVKLLGTFGMADDVKAASPDTKVVGRIYLGSQPMDGDPAARAQEWWNNHQGTILGHPDVDYWEAYNEPGNLDLGGMTWYAAFEAARVSLLAQNGRKACIGSFATGNITVPEQDPSVWAAFAPALDAAKQHGGVLGLHEYGCPMQCLFEDDTGEGWLCGRYRKVYRDYLIPNNKVIPLIVTEGGVDSIGNIPACCKCWGWRQCYTWQEYRDQLVWYDNLLREDDYVLGFTIFSLEIAGWETFDIGDANLMAWLTYYVGASGGE